MQSTNLLNIKELQIKKLLESNNFIAFVSYSNFDTNQSYEFKNSLNNLGFKAKFIQNKRLKSLLANTGYKSISSVFQGKGRTYRRSEARYQGACRLFGGLRHREGLLGASQRRGGCSSLQKRAS